MANQIVWGKTWVLLPRAPFRWREFLRLAPRPLEVWKAHGRYLAFRYQDGWRAEDLWFDNPPKPMSPQATLAQAMQALYGDPIQVLGHTLYQTIPLGASKSRSYVGFVSGFVLRHDIDGWSTPWEQGLSATPEEAVLQWFQKALQRAQNEVLEANQAVEALAGWRDLLEKARLSPDEAQHAPNP